MNRVLKDFIGLSGLLAVLLHAPQPVSAQMFPIATNPAVTEIGGGVAFDGTTYLAGLVAGTNVVGQRFARSGQLVGEPVVVGYNPGFPPAAAVASAQTNCLVAWSDTTLSTGVTAFARIWFPLTGTVGPAFPLLASVGSHGPQLVQAAASDGTNFFVAWWDAAQNNHYGQLVTSTGTLTGSELLLVTGSGGERADLAMAFGRTNYLVAWQARDELHTTYCRTVGRNGELGTPALVNITGSWDGNPLAVGFDGTDYIVVWNCTTNSGGEGELMLFGRKVTQSGEPTGPELCLVEERAAFPALAFDGVNHLLLWSAETLSSTGTIHARFLDPALLPIGPVFTPFASASGGRPLLPLNGALFDGNRFVLSATYGQFLTNEEGEVIGFAGGDVHGRFFPASTTPPEFIRLARSNQSVLAELQIVPGLTYTAEITTNLLVGWTPVERISSTETNRLLLVDTDVLATERQLFYRVALGNRLLPLYRVSFLEFAYGGEFGRNPTPSPPYPITLNSYRAHFSVVNDLFYPPASTVTFTGPAGSGLTNAPAASRYSGSDWALYESDPVYEPAAAPGGIWQVSYKATNIIFNVADPQATNRLVIPLPTVTISNDLLQSVSWVYKEPIAGSTLSNVPAYISSIQLQVDGFGGRLYNSGELPPATTNHVLTSTVTWLDAVMLYMAYTDTLTNHYVIGFSVLGPMNVRSAGSLTPRPAP